MKKLTNAKSEFNKSNKRIKRNLGAIIEQWEYLEGIYKDQVSKDPNNWRGIGRGSEMEEFEILTEKMVNLMKTFAE